MAGETRETLPDFLNSYMVLHGSSVKIILDGANPESTQNTNLKYDFQVKAISHKTTNLINAIFDQLVNKGYIMSIY